MESLARESIPTFSSSLLTPSWQLKDVTRPQDADHSNSTVEVTYHSPEYNPPVIMHHDIPMDIHTILPHLDSRLHQLPIICNTTKNMWLIKGAETTIEPINSSDVCQEVSAGFLKTITGSSIIYYPDEIIFHLNFKNRAELVRQIEIDIYNEFSKLRELQNRLASLVS